MALSRNKSILVGFGIGSVIAAAIFGVTQLRSNKETELTKAQALPQGDEREATAPVAPPAAPPPPEDSLLDRFERRPEEEAKQLAPVIQDALGIPPVPER